MKNLVWLLSAFSVLDAVAIAQAPLINWIDWDSELQPSSVAPAGDWNGDGFEDLFIGSFHRWRVRVISGVEREPLLEFPTVHAPLSIVAVRDLDSDGVADLLTSELYDNAGGNERGAARVYSGATGTVIREFFGHINHSYFGAGVDNLGDVDADSFDDFAVVSLRSQSAGLPAPPYGRVFSGRTGAVLSNYRANGSRLALNAAGDVDGDGWADLLRIESDEFVTTTSTGRARILSGRTGALIREFAAPPGIYDFGRVSGAAGDLNQDGFDDVLLGPATSWPANAVRAYSGSDGAVLLEVSMGNFGVGPVTASRAFTLGDADGDATPDFGLLSMSGILDVFSGASGELFYRRPTGVQPWTVSTPIDLNRDGLNDLALTGWYGSSLGAFVLDVFASGWPTPRRFCTPQTSSAGCVPRLETGSGGTSLTVGDPLELNAVGLSPSAPGMLLWSTASATIPFHGGTLCVAPGPALRRTAVHSSVGIGGFACSGRLRHVLRHSYLNAQGLTPGTTIYAQFISRDAGSTQSTATNLTDALAITLSP